jgi:ectoine hydroxylase-related dioxygenase (phytanoyl-CoA dioxygenase family)
MEIGDWPSSRFLNDTYRTIRTLGLEANVAELEAFGFTILPGSLSKDRVAEVKAAVLRSAERRWGKTLDPDNESDLHGLSRDTPVVTNLLFEDGIFEDLLMLEKPLLLIRYLMGESVKLNSVSSHVKAGNADGLRLHADAANGIPSPLPPYSCFANLTYVLTDYSRNGGALAMVPGSHRRCRQPSPQEAIMSRGEESAEAIPIEAKAGDAIIWHGNTWHGAFSRNEPGIRMNLIFAFCRQFVETQELIKGHVPEEVWARHRNDPVFAGLMGEYSYHGWKSDADLERAGPRQYQAGLEWHA